MKRNRHNTSSNLRYLMMLMFVASIVLEVRSQYLENDMQFVGVWGGSTKGDQKENVQKSWIQYRFPNGKFKIEFTYTYEDGSHEVAVLKGKWWIKDGIYFEKSNREADSYEVEIIDANHILFKAVKLASKYESIDYQFIDSRILDKELIDK